MISFILNGQPVRTKHNPAMVLLEFIRDVSCLSGTKEACREGECGACTVLVGTPGEDGTVRYRACASCLLPLGQVEGCHVVTVEGLDGPRLTMVQQAIVDNSASQCGFCTPGIVLSLTGFCFTSLTLSYEDAIHALDGNICRCTGYVAIRNAAKTLCENLASMDPDLGNRTGLLAQVGVIPPYFTTIPEQLARLAHDTPGGRWEGGEAGGGACQSKGGYSAPVLVAGGTDLFVQKPEELLEQELCFIGQREDLALIEIDEGAGVLKVGAAVTIEDFRTSEEVKKYFPALEGDLLLHSSTILRNKATLAGNVVNASPIGDATIILLALDARLIITDKQGEERETPLSQFFLGYKKIALACGEYVSRIHIPLLPQSGTYYHFEKVSNRATLDIAAVNTAMCLTENPDDRTVKTLRIAAGGVGPIPMLIEGLDRFAGEKLDRKGVETIVNLAEEQAKPIDDIRGSALYKKLLLSKLIPLHFAAYMEGGEETVKGEERSQ